jgi:uncharacterized protein (TIGR00730 family)
MTTTYSRSDTPEGVRWAVGVFCSGRTGIDDRHLALAVALGDGLARRGYTVVTGGSSVSCMGALARAARCRGAATIGVTIHLPAFDHLADHEARLIYAEDLSDRKRVMEEISDAFIVLAGGLGTLDELLHIWAGRAVGAHAKPLIVIDPDDLYRPLRAQIELLHQQRFVSTDARGHPFWVRTADEAFTLLETARVTANP